jgi:hypothetical protein
VDADGGTEGVVAELDPAVPHSAEVDGAAEVKLEVKSEEDTEMEEKPPLVRARG